MAQDSDEERIRRKAHELWEAEGRPHGRDQEHWDQAKEIIALQDSLSSTLLPRNTGADEPIEPRQAVENLADLPNLTDQGEHPLTDIGREPEATSPSHFINATGDTVGAVTRPSEQATPGIYDAEIVSRPPTPETISGKPAAVVTRKASSSPGAKSGAKPAGKRESATKTVGQPEPAARKGRNQPTKGS